MRTTVLEPQRLKLISAPAKLPVSLQEAKAQANIDEDFTDDDPLIAGYIEAATDEAEKFIGKVLITQTWQLFLDEWPIKYRSDIWWDGVREGAISELTEGARDLELPNPPLQSVSHVKYYDDSDNATTFSTANYFVDTASEPGRIVLRSGAAAPSITRVANGLEIQYVAGYGDNPGDVPEPIRHGIMMTVAWLYTNRGDCESAVINSGAQARWQKYKLMRL